MRPICRRRPTRRTRPICRSRPICRVRRRPPVRAARASATATSTVVNAARASPSQAATTASIASGSASASSSSKPRRTSVRRSSGDKACSRHSEVRLNRGGLTSKKGFSVVAPMSTTSPSSTAGSSTSCWDLLKRCTSSMKSMVPWPCSPRRCSAPASASRTSFTPAAVALSVTRCLAVVSARRRARVVLPVPAGPHRMEDGTRSDSASRRKGAPGATRWSWPTTSSRVRGRSRAARGARLRRRRSAASSKRLTGCVVRPSVVVRPCVRCGACGFALPISLRIRKSFVPNSSA